MRAGQSSRAVLQHDPRNPRGLRFLALCVILAALSPAARADTIYLKNGNQLVGKISRQDDRQVVYETSDGEFAIPRSLVDHIVKGPITSNAASTQDKSDRAIPASDLPLPPAEATQPASDAQPDNITEDAVDPGRLQKFDNDVLRNPSAENQRRLVLGYHDAAIYLTRQGDPEGAIELYRHAMKFIPDNLPLTLSLAYLLVKQTHYRSAIQLLLPEEDLHPDSADIPLLMGSAYYSSENLNRAVEEWKKSLALRDSQPLRDALARAEKEKETASSYDEIQSVHFLLRYDGAVAKGLGSRILDTLEAAFRDLQLDLDYYPQEQIVVVVYSKAAFRDVTRSPGWVGALNDGKIRVPVSGLTDVTPELSRVLKHELTHSFVHLIALDRCPVWFNEGLAQLEEGATTASFGSSLARQFSGGHLPPYKNLEASFMSLPQNEIVPAYSKSLAAIEFIRENYGMVEIRQMLREMATNRSVGSLIESDLRMPYSDFETAVAAYIENKYGS
jgi:tetratricopeptide (TPR) repeat protein